MRRSGWIFSKLVLFLRVKSNCTVWLKYFFFVSETCYWWKIVSVLIIIQLSGMDFQIWKLKGIFLFSLISRINHWIPASQPRIYKDTHIELLQTEEPKPHVLRLLFSVKGIVIKQYLLTLQTKLGSKLNKKSVTNYFNEHWKFLFPQSLIYFFRPWPHGCLFLSDAQRSTDGLELRRRDADGSGVERRQAHLLHILLARILADAVAVLDRASGNLCEDSKAPF